MPQHRRTQHIEVGTHEGRVGFKMFFTDGTAEVFLFDEATAAQLFHQGLALLERIRSARTASDAGVRSTVGVSESAHVRLVK